MKTKEVYSIKTFRDKTVSYAIFISVAFLLIGIFFTILDIISKREISWIERDIYFIALFLIGGPNLLIFVIRLFYPWRLIVTQEGVRLVKRKKIYFQVKAENIKGLRVRKVNPFLKIVSIPFGGNYLSDPCTDLLSIRYTQAEVLIPRKSIGGCFPDMRSLSEEEEKEAGIHEFIDGVTYRQALKISRILNIPLAPFTDEA